ncbi:MAG: cysteine hydrolase family protein [Rhizobiaceae bacterium]
MLFAPGSEWGLEWMPRVLPNIVRLCEAQPPSTVFTRFIPARRAGEGEGLWRKYYVRWRQFTLEEEGRGLVGLVSELGAFCPPARVIDKPVYSPWYGRRLRALLHEDDCDTVIIWR